MYIEKERERERGGEEGEREIEARRDAPGKRKT